MSRLTILSQEAGGEVEEYQEGMLGMSYSLHHLGGTCTPSSSPPLSLSIQSSMIHEVPGILSLV